MNVDEVVPVILAVVLTVGLVVFLILDLMRVPVP